MTQTRWPPILTAENCAAIRARFEEGGYVCLEMAVQFDIYDEDRWRPRKSPQILVSIVGEAGFQHALFWKEAESESIERMLEFIDESLVTLRLWDGKRRQAQTS